MGVVLLLLVLGMWGGGIYSVLATAAECALRHDAYVRVRPGASDY